MKSIFTKFSILAIIFLITTAAQAQFGLRGGINFATISTSDESVDLKNTIGYHLGLVYEADLTNNLTFRPGLIYTLKGTKVEFEDNSTTTNNNYFEIPLDFHLKFGDPDDNRLGIYAGPYVAFLISGDTDGGDVSVTYRDTDFGLNAGITYDIYNFTLGLNYGSSINNVADDANFGDLEVQNRVLSAFGLFIF